MVITYLKISLLVNEQELDYIAQLNPDVINDVYQNLKPEQEEE